MNHRTCLLPCLLALAGCSKPEYRARLDQAPLQAGAPVYVASVQVGTVKSVSVKGDAAEVVFTVEKEHQLELHADACALGLPTKEKGALLVRPGTTGTLEKDAALPQCRLLADALAGLAKELKDGLDSAVDDLARKLGGGSGPGPSPCALLKARVGGAEKLAPSGLFLPKGGLKVRLELENGGDTAVTLSPANSVGFADSSGTLAQVASDPADPSWFMPVELAPHGKVAVSVSLAAPAEAPAKLTVPVTFGLIGKCTAELKL